MIIPAITLWQPWACLIEIGAKKFETRSKPPPSRLIGQRIAIHAAARKQQDRDTTPESREAMDDAFGFCNWFHSLPRGAVVCTCVITEAVRVEDTEPDLFGDYSPGRWAWKLEDVFGVHPHVRAKGRQSWGWPWSVPEGVRIAP